MFAEFEVNTVMGSVIDPNQSPFLDLGIISLDIKLFNFPTKLQMPPGLPDPVHWLLVLEY